MDAQLGSLIAASVSFVGAHFLLSHPLRAGLVKALGEQGFMGVYTLLSFATLGWMIWAFRAIGPGETPLWDGTGAGLWILASLLTVLALVLLLGSLRGNPALPQVPGEAISAARASGVFAVTRHPMMWGVALWALAHMLVAPTPRVLVLMLALAVLALVGSSLQDGKKERLLGAAWAGWEAKTSFWPRPAGLLSVSPVLWIVALLAWLVITWAHMPTAHVTAGLWRWLA